MTNMSVLVRWGDRPETPEQCGQRTAQLLEELGAQADWLTSWWTTAHSRAASQPVDTTASALAAVLADAAHFTDFGKEPMPELGFTESFWNGDDEHPVGVDLTMGGTSAQWGIVNSCVLRLPHDMGPWRASDVVPLVRACVSALDPEWVGVLESDWSLELQDGLGPGVPPAAWVMYVCEERAARLVPMADDLVVETCPGGGVIVATATHEDEVDIDHLHALQQRWMAAGVLDRMTVDPDGS